VSKQRQQARAAREAVRAAELADRAAAQALERERAAKARRRGEAWRRLRLWQHGPAFRRDKEKWAALAIIVMLCLVVAYLLTSSVKAVLAVALVCVIAAPALGAFLFDRRSR
jgi:Flp pilus assembly protein TadB